MMMLTRRAEAAYIHMTKTNVKNPTASLVNDIMSRSHSEDDSRSVSENSISMDLREGTGELMVQFMENTKKELERLRADNAALKAAVEDLTREHASPSPSFSTNNHPQSQVIVGLAKLLRKEEVRTSEDTPTSSMSLKRLQVELPSPDGGSSPKRIKLEPEELPYPPLPEMPFTISLSPEAAIYSIPPKLKVEVGRIKNPPQLSVFWKEDEEDPLAPPMESYRVFYTTEQAMGSGIFQDWQHLGDMKAVPLPMFSIITTFRPGHKICVTVVGKDKFGRYGPFAKVVCAII